MAEDLLSLVGDNENFSMEQRRARASFLELALVLPREWMRQAVGVDPTAAGRVATGLYNTLVESGPADPRFRGWDTWQMAASFADLVKVGGDALIWALIRIGRGLGRALRRSRFHRPASPVARLLLALRCPA